LSRGVGRGTLIVVEPRNDHRTYDKLIENPAKAYFPFPHDFLGRAATRIINEVRGINCVVYDITSKPPGTIEWE
jgi:GMP synthase (glutamine-hydrolysing)